MVILICYPSVSKKWLLNDGGGYLLIVVNIKAQ